MSASELNIKIGSRTRGKYPVTLLRNGTVLLASEVNPFRPETIDSLVQEAVAQYPGLDENALRAELRQLAASDREQEAIHVPYSKSEAGMIWNRPTQDGGVRTLLTNFTAEITSEIVRDDGAEREVAVEVHASKGTRDETFLLSAAEFNAMYWPLERMGAEAIVFPGNSSREHARTAIQMLSPQPIARRTIYTHSGWRRVDGGNGGNGGKGPWVYLHAGGAIGESGPVGGVQVDLPEALGLYKLPDPPQDERRREVVRTALRFLDLADDSIVVPAFCAPWRAALGTCDFGLHFSGPSGAFKSELAALDQQFFGPGLDARHLPASWHSTDNALEGLLFSAKDALTVVDDFAPNGGPHELARWHQRADRVLRAQGNNAGRGRMRSDGSLRPPKPPRGLVLSTGEDIPKGHSLRARLMIVEISKGNIDAGVLTQCQHDARAGAYAEAMAGFVQYLASRYDQIRESFQRTLEELRKNATTNESHFRTPEIVANLALGLRYFLEFAEDCGAVTQVQAEMLWERGWDALQLAGSNQVDHQSASEPAQRFIELLTSSLASGHAHFADSDGGAPSNAAAWGWRRRPGSGDEWLPQGDRVGWTDRSDVFLDSEAAYRAAQQMSAGSNGLAVTERTLRKRMDEKGMLIRPDGRGELLTRRVLEGRTRNVLHLAAHVTLVESTISTISGSELEEELNALGL